MLVFLAFIALDGVATWLLMRKGLVVKRKLVLIISAIAMATVLFSFVGFLAFWLLPDGSGSMLISKLVFSVTMLLVFTILFHFEWVIRKFFEALDYGQRYIRAFIEVYRGLYLLVLGAALLMVQGVVIFEY